MTLNSDREHELLLRPSLSALHGRLIRTLNLGTAGLVLGVLLTVIYFSLATFFAVNTEARNRKPNSQEVRLCREIDQLGYLSEDFCPSDVGSASRELPRFVAQHRR